MESNHDQLSRIQQLSDRDIQVHILKQLYEQKKIQSRIYTRVQFFFIITVIGIAFSIFMMLATQRAF